jgi:hypothetical protein
VDPRVPVLLGPAHRQPCVGVQGIHARDGGPHIAGDGQPRTRPAHQPPGRQLHGMRGPQRRGAQPAGDQQGVRRVVPAIAEVAQRHLGKRLRAVIGNCEDVGEHLGGLPAVGQPVPYRHSGVGPRASRPHPGRNRDTRCGRTCGRGRGRCPRPTPYSRAGLAGPQVADVRSLIVRRDLERRAGSG